jgi:hypothetical protein
MDPDLLPGRLPSAGSSIAPHGLACIEELDAPHPQPQPGAQPAHPPPDHPQHLGAPAPGCPGAAGRRLSQGAGGQHPGLPGLLSACSSQLQAAERGTAQAAALQSDAEQAVQALTQLSDPGCYGGLLPAAPGAALGTVGSSSAPLAPAEQLAKPAPAGQPAWWGGGAAPPPGADAGAADAERAAGGEWDAANNSDGGSTQRAATDQQPPGECAGFCGGGAWEEGQRACVVVGHMRGGGGGRVDRAGATTAGIRGRRSSSKWALRGLVGACPSRGPLASDRFPRVAPPRLLCSWQAARGQGTQAHQGGEWLLLQRPLASCSGRGGAGEGTGHGDRRR